MLVTTVACVKFIALAGFIICFAYAWYSVCKFAQATQEELLREQARFERIRKAHKVLYKKYKGARVYEYHEEHRVFFTSYKDKGRRYKDHWPQPNGAPYGWPHFPDFAIGVTGADGTVYFVEAFRSSFHTETHQPLHSLDPVKQTLTTNFDVTKYFRKYHHTLHGRDVHASINKRGKLL